MDANMSLSLYVASISGGISIGLENKNKGVTPCYSGGFSNGRSMSKFKGGIDASVGVGYGSSEAFPYSIDYYKKNRGGVISKKWNYKCLGSKQVVTAYKDYVTIEYSRVKVRVYNTRKYRIQRA